MVSNIVLATNGSDHGRHALDLAAKYCATLTLVRVLKHDHPSADMGRMLKVEGLTDSTPAHNSEQGGIFMKLGRALQVDHKKDQGALVIIALGELVLKTTAKKLNDAGGKNVTSEINSGDYANCIIDVAKKTNVGMRGMGQRGSSNLKGFVTGSVSRRISQRASCSVLTVK